MKDPVVHVRVQWIIETIKTTTTTTTKTACTIDWVSQLCCSWLSSLKVTRISHWRNQYGRIKLFEKKKEKRQHLSKTCRAAPRCFQRGEDKMKQMAEERREGGKLTEPQFRPEGRCLQIQLKQHHLQKHRRGHHLQMQHRKHHLQMQRRKHHL